jgi:uncharacterized protein
MNKKVIIEKTKDLVRKELEGESTGHDWWHSYIVWRNALKIGKKEKADLFIVQMTALLHDVGDWKIEGGVEGAGDSKITKWLKEMNVEESDINHIITIITDLSFKSPTQRSMMKTKEGMVVQDADRLEALGAIGIARSFATGQKFNQPIHDPDVKPRLEANKEEYKKMYSGQYKNTTINHFYENYSY